jgi:hypothetical protein
MENSSLKRHDDFLTDEPGLEKSQSTTVTCSHILSQQIEFNRVEKQVISKERVADHGEVLTGKREKGLTIGRKLLRAWK